MTAHPAFDSPREPAGDAVAHAVGAARRRLRTINMLRFVALTAPIGVAVGVVVILVGGAPVWTAAALGLLGAAGGAAWAAAHTPTPPTVARILDTHLGLRDRVSAALQLRQTGGPIAALVARDAAARLAPVNLRALFPLTIGRVPLAATAVAVAMVAWISATGVDGDRSQSSVPSGVGGAPSVEANSRERAASGAAAATVAGQRPAGGRAVLTPDGPRGRGGETARDAPAAAAARARPPAQPPADAATEPPVLPATGTLPAATSAAAAGTTTGRDGSGAAFAARGALARGAGGASAGAAPALTTGGVTAPRWTAAAAGTARASAEAALARDAVPPDHREHVRAYFGTLASGATVAGGPR